MPAMDRKTRYALYLIGSLTLGLAPFSPMPHLFEKIGMLFAGTLHRPIDLFDLALHGLFPLLLLVELSRQAVSRLRGPAGG